MWRLAGGRPQQGIPLLLLLLRLLLLRQRLCMTAIRPEALRSDVQTCGATKHLMTTAALSSTVRAMLLLHQRAECVSALVHKMCIALLVVLL